MLRLYMDEDSMNQDVVHGLRVRGIDVLTAVEAGMGGHVDSEHLEFAANQGPVLCTFNIRDFSALHAHYLVEGRRHAGILLVHQQRYAIGEYVRRMLRLASSLFEVDMVNRAEYLSSGNQTRRWAVRRAAI